MVYSTEVISIYPITKRGKAIALIYVFIITEGRASNFIPHSDMITHNHYLSSSGDKMQKEERGGGGKLDFSLFSSTRIVREPLQEN